MLSFSNYSCIKFHENYFALFCGSSKEREHGYNFRVKDFNYVAMTTVECGVVVRYTTASRMTVTGAFVSSVVLTFVR